MSKTRAQRRAQEAANAAAKEPLKTPDGHEIHVGEEKKEGVFAKIGRKVSYELNREHTFTWKKVGIGLVTAAGLVGGVVLIGKAKGKQQNEEVTEEPVDQIEEGTPDCEESTDADYVPEQVEE